MCHVYHFRESLEICNVSWYSCIVICLPSLQVPKHYYDLCYLPAYTREEDLVSMGIEKVHNCSSPSSFSFFTSLIDDFLSLPGPWGGLTYRAGEAYYFTCKYLFLIQRCLHARLWEREDLPFTNRSTPYLNSELHWVFSCRVYTRDHCLVTHVFCIYLETAIWPLSISLLKTTYWVSDLHFHSGVHVSHAGASRMQCHNFTRCIRMQVWMHRDMVLSSWQD